MTKTESPFNIKQTNYEDIQNNKLGDYLVDPIPDSSNSNHKDCMAYRRIMNEFLGVKGLIGNNFAWWCTLTFCCSIFTTSAMIFPQKRKNYLLFCEVFQQIFNIRVCTCTVHMNAVKCYSCNIKKLTAGGYL